MFWQECKVEIDDAHPKAACMVALFGAVGYRGGISFQVAAHLPGKFSIDHARESVFRILIF